MPRASFIAPIRRIILACEIPACSIVPTKPMVCRSPFKAIIAPRPIVWIGTLNADGVPIDSNDLRNLRRVMQLHIASDIAVASGATTPSRRTA